MGACGAGCDLTVDGLVFWFTGPQIGWTALGRSAVSMARLTVLFAMLDTMGARVGHLPAALARRIPYYVVGYAALVARTVTGACARIWWSGEAALLPSLGQPTVELTQWGVCLLNCYYDGLTGWPCRAAVSYSLL